MPGIDPFASITGAVLDLLTQDGDLPPTRPDPVPAALAVIVIAWFGIPHPHACRGLRVCATRRLRLLLTIAFWLRDGALPCAHPRHRSGLHATRTDQSPCWRIARRSRVSASALGADLYPSLSSRSSSTSRHSSVISASRSP